MHSANCIINTILVVNIFEVVQTTNRKNISAQINQSHNALNNGEYFAVDVSDNMEVHLTELCVYLNISLLKCNCKDTEFLCSFEAFLSEELNETFDEELPYSRSNTHTLIYASVTIIVSAFSLIGNGVVLIVAIKYRRNLSSCKLHIAQLSFVSLIFSAVQIVNAIPLFITNAWFESSFSCKFVRTTLEIGSLLIIDFIVIIAIERYMLIVHSIDAHFLNGRSKHIIVAADVTFVVLSVIPYYVGLDIEQDSGRCIQFQGAHKTMSIPYNWFIVVFHSIIPLIIISILHYRIIQYISEQTNAIDTRNNQSLHMKRLLKNKRIVNILLAIVLCFLLCTLPTRVIILFMDMNYMHKQGEGYYGMDMDIHLTIVFIGYVTYPFQSTINPVLYSMIDTEWRNDLRSVLRKLRFGWDSERFFKPYYDKNF